MKGFNINLWKLLKVAIIRQLEYTGTAIVLQELTIAPSRIVEKDVT